MKLAAFVKDNQQKLDKFVINARKYISMAEPFVRGDNPGLAGDAARSLKDLESPAPASGYVEVYEDFEWRLAAMAPLMHIISDENYLKRLTYNRFSSADEVTEPRRRAIDAKTAFETPSDAGVFEESLKSVTPDDIYRIVTTARVTRYTTKLLAHAMKLFDGDRRATIAGIIEKQKDAVLGAVRHKLPFPGVQALTSRASLIPKSAGVPISTIVADDGGWAKLATEGPGIIVINASVGTPLEFNLRGLIDAEFIAEHSLKTSPFTGINKKVLERFNTVYTIPGPPSTAPPVQIFPGNAGSWRVFQLLTAEICREMRFADVGGLVEGLNGRAHAYNKIQSDIILERCYDPRAGPIIAEYENFKALTTSSEVVRAAILSKLSEKFRAELAARGNVNAFTVGDIATNGETISTVLVEILINSTGLRGRTTPEHILTYLSKFDGVVRAFTKELEKRWAKAGIAPGTFRDYRGDKLIDHLTSAYESAVVAALQELDKTNAWSEYDLTVKEYFLEKKLI